MGRSKKWFKALVGTNKSTKTPPTGSGDDNEKVPTDKNNEKVRTDKNKFWQWKNQNSQGSVCKGMFDKFGPMKEEKAAIYIQTAFRAYLARKTLRSLKGLVRLQAHVHGQEVKKQAAMALQSMQSWIRVQNQIWARRSYMVTEGRSKQKKREHQLKLEAELHELEVDWLDGAETMEEILARVQHREEAAVRRERALAYAFSHQWRPNSRSNLGYAGYELDKTNWGWSWIERWIAVRPWENRLFSQDIKDCLENTITSNGHKYGQKNLVGVTVKKPPLPSTDNGNTKTCSTEKVPSHDSDNSINNTKEPQNIADSGAKKKVALPKVDKQTVHKMNKPRQKVSQVADAAILAS